MGADREDIPWAGQVLLAEAERVFLAMLVLAILLVLVEQLDQIIVSGGKTSQEIKEMPYLDKKMHAQQCDKNRNIKAKDIGDIATKMGCPEEKTTKIAKLMWICTEYLHDPHAYN